jgi:DNA invertase Pin-like site-specific DNA recombinase
MFAAINGMMLDMLAAVARKDCDDRRRRQAQGISNAKAAGSYRGRPENTGRNAGIGHMLADGASWTAVQHATGCSRAPSPKSPAAPEHLLSPLTAVGFAESAGARAG